MKGTAYNQYNVKVINLDEIEKYSTHDILEVFSEDVLVEVVDEEVFEGKPIPVKRNFILAKYRALVGIKKMAAVKES